jgi:hypothetical protein
MNRLRLFSLRCLGIGLAALFALAQSAAAADARTAQYRVRLLQAAPPKLAVAAILPIEGRALEMETTRPVMPELDELGWPALVANLRVSDAQGRPLPATRTGPKGWLLDQPHSGPLKVEYKVDYSPLAARGWPAPREAAFADASHIVVIGRSLFLTTPNAGSSDVTFDLPKGWLPVVPWERRTGSEHAFGLGSSGDLTENFIVLSRSRRTR